MRLYIRSCRERGLKLLTDIEKKLIMKCKKGDIGSFEKLIANYQKTAFNIAYRMMGNEEDAKDMSQEGLIKVYKSIKNFRLESEFSTWLYRIVMNVCKDELRKRKMKVISIDQGKETEDGVLKSEIRDNALNPEEVLTKKEDISEIQTALMKLSDTHREVVILRDVKCFSYDEIAEMTELTKGTVKSRINRGRKELKEILLDAGIFPSSTTSLRKEGK